MSDIHSIEKKHSWRMFNRIAASYDLLNRILSMGIDQRWRRKVAQYLPEAPEKLRVLDLATGTGDQILALWGASSERIQDATGMDLAEEMLEKGREKFARQGLRGRCVLQTGDAQAIPAQDSLFDFVTISFGIRNVPDPLKALREMIRVLRPGGRVVVLEFSLPANALCRSLYLFYFRRLLPWIGGMVSGEPEAYRYLNQTVEQFPYGKAFCSLMETAGFEDVERVPLTFGIATIYVGSRPEINCNKMGAEN